jgi:hypothetical protein
MIPYLSYASFMNVVMDHNTPKPALSICHAKGLLGIDLLIGFQYCVCMRGVTQAQYTTSFQVCTCLLGASANSRVSS